MYAASSGGRRRHLGMGATSLDGIVIIGSGEFWEMVFKKLDPYVDSLIKEVGNTAISTIKSRSKDIAKAAVPALIDGIKPRVPEIVDSVLPQMPKVLKAVEAPLEDWAVNRLYPGVVRKIADRELKAAEFKAKFGISRAAAGTGSILALSVVAYLVLARAKQRKSEKP